jgi:hypothetical protein
VLLRLEMAMGYEKNPVLLTLWRALAICAARDTLESRDNRT